jgi:predicted GH43/DUF377 family glycosyl hydrolase
MKLAALALCLCPFVARAASDSAQQTGWQTAPEPALASGDFGSWDDFAIREASVLQDAKGFTLFYKAVTFSIEELTSAIGVAHSADGVKWEKFKDNPIFAPSNGAEDEITSFTATKWNDQFWAAYAVPKEPEEKPQVELAHSDDGIVWQSTGQIEGLVFEIEGAISPQPCLYAEGPILHLWWIGQDGGKDFLFHSISRDAKKWSEPTKQPTTEIDSREMSAVRIYPSGNYYVLVYVAHDENKKRFSIVTKISREARSWFSKGPPEFVIERPLRGLTPAMVFTPEGARLFYPQALEVKQTNLNNSPRASPSRGCVLRTAFCAKSAYVGY